MLKPKHIEQKAKKKFFGHLTGWRRSVAERIWEMHKLISYMLEKKEASEYRRGYVDATVEILEYVSFVLKQEESNNGPAEPPKGAPTIAHRVAQLIARENGAVSDTSPESSEG